MTTHGSNSSPAAHSEVRPEELTELVERLHRREERLSVNDVAETLGVAPEQVESTLRAMRSERVPPTVSRVKPRKSLRKRVRVAGAILFAGLLIGGMSFSLGRDSGFSAARYARPFSSAPFSSRPDALATELRAALPAGMTVSVGDVKYTGSRGTISADEGRMAALISALINREISDATYQGGKSADPEPAAQLLRAEPPVASDGISMVKLEVTNGKARYQLEIPKITGSFMPPHTIAQAAEEVRGAAARKAANRLAEWREQSRSRASDNPERPTD